MSNEQRDVLNCSLDLQRAAKFYFLDPTGTTYKTFFDHATHTLSSVTGGKSKECMIFLRDIEARFGGVKNSVDREHLAEKILSVSSLLKGIA